MLKLRPWILNLESGFLDYDLILLFFFLINQSNVLFYLSIVVLEDI